MDPNKLTALDGKGNVIRSIVLDSDDDRPSAASPDMSDLQCFAKLLAEGYDKGSKASQPLVDHAMQFVERQSVRLAKAESEIERLRAHIHKLNLHVAELSQAPAAPEDGGIMGALMTGVLQAGQLIVPPPNVSAIKVPQQRRDYEGDKQRREK